MTGKMLSKFTNTFLHNYMQKYIIFLIANHL